MKKRPIKQSIVILHGWASSPRRWETFQTSLNSRITLTNGARVLIPALPGFDGSNLKKPMDVEAYCAWLNSYMIDNELKTIVLMGHSNGGRIAIRFAAQYPQLVSHLILIGAAGIKDKRLLRNLKQKMFGFAARTGKFILDPIKKTQFFHIAENILYKLAGEHDYQSASPIMKETMKNLLEYDAEMDLNHIKTPTLCVWGELDRSTPLWMGKKISQTVFDAKLKIIKNAGHNLHVSNTDVLAENTAKFILNHS